VRKLVVALGVLVAGWLTLAIYHVRKIYHGIDIGGQTKP